MRLGVSAIVKFDASFTTAFAQRIRPSRAANRRERTRPTMSASRWTSSSRTSPDKWCPTRCVLYQKLRSANKSAGTICSIDVHFHDSGVLWDGVILRQIRRRSPVTCEIHLIGAVLRYFENATVVIGLNSDAISASQVWNEQTSIFPDFAHPRAAEYWKLMFADFHKQVQFDGAWIVSTWHLLRQAALAIVL